MLHKLFSKLYTPLATWRGVGGEALFVFLLLFISCSKEDDRIVVQTEHQWVDKKVAVVYPNRNPIAKAQLERTAQWFLENFQEAQLAGDVCVRLKLEWYDELTSNLDGLSAQLANDTSVVAIVGPFKSTSLEIFAQACQQTEKPLIAPTATSEEVIRRYAVPTQSGSRTVRPFLWSLTESDVAFAEVMMSAYATFTQEISGIPPSAMVFSPDNVYGKTFFDWAPFQAENLGLELSDNLQYASTDDLLQQFKEAIYSVDDYFNRLFYANFCVIEDMEQLTQVTAWRRKCYIDYLGINDLYGLPDTTPYDDPVYDGQAEAIELSNRTYFALSDFSQEEINALTERQRAILQCYQGFSPYADPTTGFEMSYERKFGVKPTFEECKFYGFRSFRRFRIVREHRLQSGHLRPYVRQHRRQPERLGLGCHRHGALPAPAGQRTGATVPWCLGQHRLRRRELRSRCRHHLRTLADYGRESQLPKIFQLQG